MVCISEIHKFSDFWKLFVGNFKAIFSRFESTVILG